MEGNSLEGLNDEYAALIKEYLDKIKNRVTGVLLFGSVSRHEELPFPQSDIDISFTEHLDDGRGIHSTVQSEGRVFSRCDP